MNILLGKSTRRDIEHFLAHPRHSLGLIGDKGMGKFHVALYIAGQLLEIDPHKDSGEIHIVRPNEKGSILIDDIRGITSFLKLRSVSRKTIARVIIIEAAEAMTTEAQNALLKTLEEPPKDSVIIMTISSPSRLLTTVRSRLTTIQLQPPSKEATVELFELDHPKHAIEKAWLISNGRLGLMTSLLNESEHPLLPYLDTAKTIITNNKHQRLLMIDSLAKQDLPQVFQALMIVSTTAFKGAVNKGSPQQIAQWHGIRSTIYDYSQKLQYNPNNKLLLTDLMLQL